MRFQEIRYRDPLTKTYLGSPSLVRLEGGDLLATHDYFGPGCPRNHEEEEHLTSVYRVVRTAYGGAHNFHDANRITFHRIKSFRRLI